jgi:opacity protein-like surface antigen
MRKILGILGALLLGSTAAMAADLPVKAPPLVPVPPVVYCTTTACTGFYGGLTVAESGGSFDVISSGLGGIASNNINIGGDAGYEIYNGVWYLAAEVDAVYGVVANGNLPGGGNTNQWGIGALGKVGYSLASLFGGTPGAPPTLPASLAQNVISPYVILGVWDRPWGAGFASGVGIQALLMQNWTLSVDYLHVNYNNAAINPNLNQQTEDMVMAHVDRHF